MTPCKCARNPLTHTVYLLQVAAGTSCFGGSDAVFAVDAQYPQVTIKVQAAIRELTSIPFSSWSTRTGTLITSAGMRTWESRCETSRARKRRSPHEHGAVHRGTKPPDPQIPSGRNAGCDWRHGVRLQRHRSRCSMLNAHTDGDLIVHFTKSFHDKENAKKQYALRLLVQADGGAAESLHHRTARRDFSRLAARCAHGWNSPPLLDMICAVSASEGAA